jgi:hypothetical protein
MELPDHLLQHHNIDTLLVVEVVAGLRLLLLDIQQSLVHLAVLVAEVHHQHLAELQEPQILVVEVVEVVWVVVMAVQVLLLFNIQNKEIKTYGTFCSNWIRK